MMDSFYDSAHHNTPLVHKAVELLYAENEKIGVSKPDIVWEVVLKPLAYKTCLEVSVLDRAFDLYAEDYFGCPMIKPQGMVLAGSDFDKERQSWILSQKALQTATVITGEVYEDGEGMISFRVKEVLS